ncbi:uncharacterized protein N7515_009762 [Penicillium bovifimosum]|uniref:Uncharacterized protein n=1 Tax=Penicillium bovifimosum TaxID=126998 RepID=A0A9W9GI94_9EURO|nr:uncharacterized protein N7515_009762 [Penicillium bovifimosum]KAJ5120374.1 hypothetical protein N7515_009762 [Penicillium bovifimosum]
METVSQYVKSASNVIWGENTPEGQRLAAQQSEEPISGNTEQPGTIPTEGGNTAPQEPILSNKHTPQGGTSTTHADPSTAKSTDNVDVPFSTPAGAGTSLSTSTGDHVHGSSTSTAKPTSAAKPVSGGGSAVPTGSVEDDVGAKEQRGTDTVQSGKDEAQSSAGASKSEGEGKKDEGEARHFANPQGASEEALKGPQGPAPKVAEDFEKESKRKSVGIGANDASTDAKDHAHGKTGQSEQKHGAMSKVKDSVKKHLHKSS